MLSEVYCFDVDSKYLPGKKLRYFAQGCTGSALHDVKVHILTGVTG